MKKLRVRRAGLGLLVVTLVAGLSAPAGAKGGKNPPPPPPPPPPPSGPAAPTLLAPANAAQVVEPFTISWSAVNDPNGIQAYNWQVAVASDFATVVAIDSTMGPTQSTVSGLPISKTYFWRVQAVSSAGQGAWSSPRSVTVTGAGPNAPGTAVLNPPRGGTTQFHPMEHIEFTWSAVPGVSTYRYEASTRPDFPVASMVLFDNIPEPRAGMAFHDSLQGNWLARVVAVDANGIRGVPSNTTPFSVFYTNPIGPAPTIVSPVGNPTVPLPVTLTWNHVPNPQPSGYEVQIATDSGFATIEDDHPQLNGPSFTFISLTAGPKFWRVRSFQGDSSPTTAAATAWSPTGTFTVPNTPPTVTGVPLTRSAPFSGETEDGTVQLSRAAPAGGSVVNLSSSDPSVAPVPASVNVPAGFAVANFSFQTGQVVAAKDITITATLNNSSAATTFHLQPPSLKELALPFKTTGGVTTGGPLMLNGNAPASGAVVSLTSDSTAAQPPPTVTVPAGEPSTSVLIPTSEVPADTLVTITASWNGGVITSQFTLTPPVPPASIVIDPATTTGTNGSSGVVRIAAPVSTDTLIALSSSNEAIARTDHFVMIPAGAVAGSFLIFTSPPAATTTVTIAASAGGVTKSAPLTVNPFPSAPLPAPNLLSPAEGARFAVGSPVAFDWSDVANASSYQIQVSTAQNFTANAIDRVVTTSQLSASLAQGDYFWRVRANDSAANPGAWSATRSFRLR